MQRKFLIGAVGGAVAVTAVFGVGTHALAGTQSTSRLDEYSTASVGGHKALAANIVEGRTRSKYHPLPWVGTKVDDIACPTGLKAVAGASVTCTGRRSDGEHVSIPVSVVKATSDSVTWKFQR
ncbi:DUF4333 domain-containing protein [Streptomyces lincolnensis]|uniref:DUF4333 domain-containing protein n=1 Tax=Streptomyces lincolnensis TaxID=1915 RepID=UPI000833E9EB|nr:DUF4333 domain-containing protein [Streptomyces lincolnensis]QMV11037.1 DUF4333 domain-containing protein [Streptomyces lincolnensis]